MNRRSMTSRDRDEADCGRAFPLPHGRGWWPVAMVVLLLLVVCMTRAASAEDWPRFRGPNGSGVGDANIPAKWAAADYRWKVELPGEGHGSPVVVGDRVFLQSADGDGAQRLVVCVDAATGRIRWSKAFDSQTHRKHKFNSFASSTPAADDQRVYACWATPQQLTVVAGAFTDSTH